MLPLTAVQISSLCFYYNTSSRPTALPNPSFPTHPLTDCALAPPCLLLFRPSVWDGLSADTKETSGWCHVTQLPFQGWHQWGESFSFFPEYDPKVLAPLCESTAPPQILNPEHLVFLTSKPASHVLCSNSQICQIQFFVWQKKHSMVPRIHTGKGSLHNNGGQTRTAVFAQLQPGCFNWLNVPRGKNLWKKESGPSNPVCAPPKQPRPFVWLAPLHRVQRWALNYLWFSLAHSQGKKREHGNQETNSVIPAPHSAQQRLNYTGKAPPI